MRDDLKTREQLIDELTALRREVSNARGTTERGRSGYEVDTLLEWLKILPLPESEAVYVWDLTKNRMWCHKVIQKALNVSETIDDPGSWWTALLHPDDRERMVVNLAELLKGDQKFGTEEYRLKASDGSYMEISHRAYVVRDGEGKPVVLIGAVTDISERKRTEKALRASEERYRDILETIQDGYAEMDLRGNFTFFNEPFRRMMGYTCEELTGMNYRQYAADEENARKVYQAYNRGYETGEPIRIEWDVRRKNGERRTIEVAVSLIRNTEGLKTGFMGIVRDVTERKRAEEELRESRKKLEDIISFLPDATAILDKDGRVLAWNRAMEEMTGVKAQEMLGKGDHEYSIPFYGERRPILIDLVLNPQEEIEAKYTMRRRGDVICEGETYVPALRGRGAYLYGRVSALRDANGNVVGAIESIRDITARRLAEEKYRAIFENAVMGICQISTDGRILSANPAYARIIGYESPEELLHSVTDAARQVFVHPEERSELLKTIHEYGTVQDREVQWFRKDGSIAWVTINGRSVKDGSGKVIHYEGAVRDITEHKSLEQQLHQAYKMEAIGTLAGGIAHDFNNILSAVIGYAEMAARESDLGTVRRYLDEIYQAGIRAGDLVQQILTFSRQSEEKRYPLRIGPIIKEAMKLLRASIPTTIKIHQNIHSDQGHIMASPTHIHQILMNLCTNAAHAMGAGRGALSVRLAPVDIKSDDGLIHHGLIPGTHLKLTVSDTGCGIAPGIIDKIFDPFFTTKRPGEGTGMGLSVVHGIVKSSGGAITVQSEVGKGTEFDVYFPLLKEKGAVPQKEASTPIVGGEERILFVDDEEVLVELGKNMLSGLGYRVEGRTSSLEALELFRTEPERFDLVITDMTMPNMTGLELAQELMRIRPDIPVILCTGFSELVTAERAKSLGLKEFIMKPVVLRQLAGAVRRSFDDNQEG